MSDAIKFGQTLQSLKEDLLLMQYKNCVIPVTQPVILSHIEAFHDITIGQILLEPHLVKQYKSTIDQLFNQFCIELRGCTSKGVMIKWLQKVKSHIAFYTVGHVITWSEPATSSLSTLGHTHNLTHQGAVILPEFYNEVMPDEMEQLTLLMADCRFEMTTNIVDKTYSYKGN